MAGSGKKDADAQSIINKIKPFTDKMTTVGLWIALPLGTLGLLSAGALYMVGNARASKVGASVLIGGVVVACAQVIAK
jgi:hypothetical protein